MGSRGSGAWFPAWTSESAVLWCCFWGNQACWLVPSVTRGAVEAVGPAYTGVPVSLAFQGEGVAGCVVGGSMELWVPVCARKQDLTPSKHWVMEPRTTWWLQGWGIGSVELRVVFPILSMVSSLWIWKRCCFSLFMRPHGCILGSSDLPFSG
jgi:hypothetical protein